jgi:hypothetical protein
MEIGSRRFADFAQKRQKKGRFPKLTKHYLSFSQILKKIWLK